MEFVTDDSKKSSLWVPSVKSSNLENKFSQTDDFYRIWLWFPSKGQSWRHEKCPCFLRLYLLSGCGPSWTVGWQWASLSHLARCGWCLSVVCVSVPRLAQCHHVTRSLCFCSPHDPWEFWVAVTPQSHCIVLPKSSSRLCSGLGF